MTYLFVAGLVIAAVSAGYLVWAQIQLLKNLDAAWPERQEVAKQAGEIERDERAPENVRTIAKLLADNAFDDDFVRKLRAGAGSRGKTDSSRLLRQMKANYGERYGDKLYKLIVCFAGITLYTELSEGRRLKARLSHQQLKDLRRLRARWVFDALSTTDEVAATSTASPAHA